jgi:hypothetical protein
VSPSTSGLPRHSPAAETTIKFTPDRQKAQREISDELQLAVGARSRTTSSDCADTPTMRVQKLWGEA